MDLPKDRRTRRRQAAATSDSRNPPRHGSYQTKQPPPPPPSSSTSRHRREKSASSTHQQKQRQQHPSLGSYYLSLRSDAQDSDATNELSKLRARREFEHRMQLKQRQLRQRQARRESRRRKGVSDDYLLSNESAEEFHGGSGGLYAARMKYLKEKRLPSQQRDYRRPPSLTNFANSDQPPQQHRKSQKTFLTYDQDTQSPSKDLQTLVLVLVRDQLRDEVLHLSEVANEQSPFEMRNMRLNSFIANTPDLMDHWKVVMLEESMRIVDESFDHDNLAWVSPGCGDGHEFAMPMDEHTMVSLPADKPEISKSQVATEYIQAQRGQLGNDQEDSSQLFQNELLKAENAAGVTPEVFERICACYKIILQKAVEIEFIESKPETCQAVNAYVEQLKSNVDRVVQDSLTQNLVDAGVQGGAFLRVLVGLIMDDLHETHKERSFKPFQVQISAQRLD